MSHRFPHFTLRKRILLLLLPVLLFGCMLLHRMGYPLSHEKRFALFTNQVFRSELSANTLDLHYTLANPASYDLDDLPVVLGNGSLQSKEQSLAACENYLSALRGFNRAELNQTQQLTHDLLLDYLETECSSASLLLYDEPLSPSLGVQSQLPILLAEYSFRTKGDIEDYLTLLTQMPDYFDSILSFEQQKSAAGLFMSDICADAVIRQCRDFIADPSSNYLITTFREKIETISNLTADEKIAYCDRCEKSVLTYVIPAYETLISGLQSLSSSGKNDIGLAGLPKGKEYYQYLVRSSVGDSRPIEEIEEAIKQQMTADFADAQKLIADRSPNLPSDASAASSSVLSGANPAEMLLHLRSSISTDFPQAPSVSCAVRQVPLSLQEYLSPAFYLTPAIDAYTDNVIYINPHSDSSGLELYTTLAHEGYPGHLYQSVFFQSQSPDPIRSLLGCGGYTEGWATYVEMYAYNLWDGDDTAAALAQKNRAFTLGIASLLDIGIHYHGYSRSEVSSFLTQLGFSDETAQALYDSILQSPANYLKYYVGWLNFEALRADAQAQMGDTFSLIDFHESILRIGPAPFSILRQYLLS